MSETPDTDQLGSRVISVIARTQRISAEDITPDSTFEQLKIDSLDGINIVFALENEFEIEIPDEGVQSMRSVRQIMEGIKELLDAKSRAAISGGG
jgi:acyl carrier protein